MRKVCGIVCGLLMASMPLTAQALMTAKEMQVIANTLTYVESPELSQEVPLTIFYSDANEQSRQSMDQLRALLGNGYRVDRYQFIPRFIPIESGQAGEGRVVFITEGLTDHFQQLSLLAAKHHLLTISSDFACVSQNVCVLAIQAEPELEIAISRQAAEQNSVRFSKDLLAEQVQ